jgi:hypothetical protein
VFGLDAEALAASLVDEHGGELAALDLVQHRLPGQPEGVGGLVEGESAVGHLGADAVTQRLVDPDPPGCGGGELLSEDESLAQPPVDGVFADAELAGGFRDADHAGIVAAGTDSFRFGRLVGRDPVGDSQRLHPGFGPGQFQILVVNSSSGREGEFQTGEVAGATSVEGVAVPVGVQADHVERDG